MGPEETVLELKAEVVRLQKLNRLHRRISEEHESRLRDLSKRVSSAADSLQSLLDQKAGGQIPSEELSSIVEKMRQSLKTT